MMSVQNQYNDNGYKNWLRACLGLKYMKQGIINFVDAEVKQLHLTIITNVCGSRICNQCTTNDVTRGNRCPNNVCNIIRQEIERNHRFPRPCWQNTDATSWCSDYWEIGKCFMSPGYATKSTAAETDCSGLLSICINGLFLPLTLTGQIILPGAPPADIFHKNREARNDLLHSGTMSLTDAERQAYIQDMIMLLTCYKQPIDQATQDAISRLTELNTNIFITATDELGVLKTKLEAIGNIQTDVKTAIGEIGELKTKAGDNQTNIEDVSSKLDELKTQADCNQTAIKRTEDAIDAVEKTHAEAIGNIHTDVKTAIGEIGELKTKAGDNQKDIEDVSSKLDTLKTQADCNKTSIKRTEDAIDAVEKTHAEAIGNIQTDVKRAIGEIGELKTKAGDNQKDIEDVSSKLGALKTQADCNKSAIKRTEDAIDAVEKTHAEAIGNLQTDVKTYIGEIGELKTKAGDNKKDIEDASSKLAALKTQADGNQTAIKRTEDAIDAVEKTHADSLALVDDKLENHEKDVTEMKTACKALQEKNESQCNEIDNLRKRIELYTARIDKVEDKVDKVEDKVTEMRKDLDATRNAARPVNTARGKRRQLKYVKEYLVEKYKRDIVTIPMSPLLHRIGANVDDVYTELIIRDDLVHKPRDQMKDKCRDKANARHWQSGRSRENVQSYHDVLYDGQTPCQNIYVVGKAGVGKTTWSRKFVASWIRAMEYTGRYNELNENETVLHKYCLVFYVSLRHSQTDTHIMEMIEHQLFPHATDLFSITKILMEYPDVSSRCIIMMDGLDEWSSHEHLSSSDGLPLRDPRWQTAFITTTRSWKLEALQLEAGKIDRAIEIQGLQESGVNRLIAHVVSTLNKNSSANKNAADFQSQVTPVIKDCINVPLLLTIFVCLWYENDALSRHFAGIYGGLVNLLIQYAEGNTNTRLFQKVLPHKLKEMKEKWKEHKCSVLDSLPSNSLLVTYLPFLLRLGKLAFNTLFANNKEFTLVFDYQSIENVLHEDELELSVNIGLLSQTIQPESVLEHQFTLSFLHKTVQEYFAALYMACGNHTSDCLNRYKAYCANNPHRIMEMENILLFLSGLCPDVAAEIQCHIADLQAHKQVFNLFLSCWKEEHALSAYLTTVTTNANIDNILYIIALEKTSDYCGFKQPIKQVPRKSRQEGDVSNYSPSSESELNMSGCKVIRKLVYKLPTGVKQVPIDSQNQSVICHYSPSTESELDVGCRVLQTVQCQLSSGVLGVQTERLMEIEILCYCPSTMTVLDMSGCKTLRKLEYTWSSAAIRLPTESLEEVVIQKYEPSTESVLNISGCKTLRKLQYTWSSAAIRLPTESLEEVLIHGYRPNTKSVLDMSGCKTLRKIKYTCSSAAIRLPTENLEEVLIQEYRPSSESVLDMSGCKTLRKLEYMLSSMTIRLPTESLEEVVILYYHPSTESVLDISGCKTLRKLEYRKSYATVRLPTQRLEEVVIQDYKLSTESVLDMSGCKTLRKLEYTWSSAAIRLPTQRLEEVVIVEYSPSTESVLDMSGCKTLRKLEYRDSSAAIRLQTESLEEVVIQDYSPSTESVLDMSGCKTLRKLKYKDSSAAIRLPTERLQEVVIGVYRHNTKAALDMSGCKTLRKLEYTLSSAAIRLPTESLEEVVIQKYEPSTESVLDMSGCKTLRKLEYRDSSAAIRLPTESLEEVVIQDYSPSTESVLDMSGCKTLRKLVYTWSSAAIRLPTESLEEVLIQRYRPSTESVLDMSECKTLRNLKYTRSSAAIRLPTESLEDVVIQYYTPSTESVLDMSGCKALRKLKYRDSSAAIRLPTESLEEVAMDDYRPSTKSVLDMSGCKVLKKLKYMRSCVAIWLPTESLEEVVIYDYKPSTKSVLDMSECKTLWRLDCRDSSAAIRLPTHRLEEVVMQDCDLSTEAVSGCKTHTGFKCRLM